MDTGRCASEDAGPGRGWIPGGVPARMLGPEEGDYEITYRLERGTKHSL